MTDSFHRSLDSALSRCPDPTTPVETVVSQARALASDDDLPGMWSHADFEGGDPDERSYAERGWAPGAPFVQVDVQPYIDAVNEAVADLVALAAEEPVAYDGFGAPLYAHQVPPEGTE